MATYDTDNPGFAGDALRSPSIVSGIKTESTILQVSSSNPDGVDALSTKLSACGLTTELELSLLAVVGSLSTSLRALVPG